MARATEGKGAARPLGKSKEQRASREGGVRKKKIRAYQMYIIFNDGNLEK